MVIFDERYKPWLIEDIHTPVMIDYFWVLDIKERDFMISKLTMLEEHQCAVLALKILDWVIEVPTDWNILVYSEETSQLDLVTAAEASRGRFDAVVFQHKNDRVLPGRIIPQEYIQAHSVVTPSFKKTEMLCHAIGPDYWVCLSPSDGYNKYLDNAVIGDLYE